MNINEAKQILNENGYVLEEGKLGRALGAIGLAIGSLFSHAHADINNLDLKTATEEEIQELKDTFEKESDISYCKIKNKGLVCKDTNNTVTIYPTESLKNAGISDDVTEIIFPDGYKNKEKLEGIIFNYKDGSKKSLTHKIGEKYGYITELDEFDTEVSKKMISIGEVEEQTSSIYSDVVKELSKPSKKQEEQKIIDNFSYFTELVPINIMDVTNDDDYVTLSSDELPKELKGGYVKYNDKKGEYLKCKNLKSIGQIVCTVYDTDYNEKTFAIYNRQGHLVSLKDVASGNEFTDVSTVIKPGYTANNYVPGKTGFFLTDNGTKEVYIKNGKIIKTGNKET